MSKLLSLFILSLLVGCSSADKSKPDPKSAAVDSSNVSSTKGEDKQTLGSYKDLVRAIETNNKVEVERLVRGYLSKDEKDIKALNALGVYHFTQKKYGLAKLIFQKILQDKSLASVHHNLGLVYLAESEEESAIVEFKKALNLDSSHVLASAHLGEIHLKYKNYEKALELLEFAYSVNKRNVALANNYAVALRATGDLDRARNIYESIGGREKNVTVLLNYALLLGDGLKNVEKAKEIINKIKFLTTSPDIIKTANDLLKRLEGGSTG